MRLSILVCLLAVALSGAGAQHVPAIPASAWGGADAARMAALSLDGSLHSAERWGLHATLAGTGSRDLSRGAPSDLASASALLSMRAGTSGAWAGMGVDGSHIGPSRSIAPLSLLGVWKQLHSVMISVGTSQRSVRNAGTPSTVRTLTTYDSLYTDTSGWQRLPRRYTVGDSGTSAVVDRWMDNEGRVSWSAGRLSLDALLGARPGTHAVRSAAWGHGGVSVQLAHRVAISAGIGARLARVPGPEAVERFASAGLRVGADVFRPTRPPAVRPTAAAFSVTRADSVVIISIHVPQARSVELSGDFNRWMAVPLRQTAADRWEVALDLAAGSHLMNVRIDGGQWTAPPGTPTVADEFRGTVGVIVVR